MLVKEEGKTMNLNNIAIFCGSSNGANESYVKAANDMGKFLALTNRKLIYGGAKVGCMGELANASLTYHGHVIGVIPQKLVDVEIAHEDINELHTVADMHERKAKMAELADGFIALPGGAGTLEEWFEVFTWLQLGYHKKPCGFLNINGFYDPLISMLENTVKEGFMKKSYLDLIIIDPNPKSLIEKMEAFEMNSISKW